MTTDGADTTPPSSWSSPIRVALLGAGIFATNAHAPVFERHRNAIVCRAVWSRRHDRAERLAMKIRRKQKGTMKDDGDGSDPDDNADAVVKSYGGEEGLEELLMQKELDAVVIVLPLDVQKIYIRRALMAGKHVLSEKPVAESIVEASRLIGWYRRNGEECVDPSSSSMSMSSSSSSTISSSSLVWSVAENYRYEPAIVEARRRASSCVGIPFLFQMTIHAPFSVDNRYLIDGGWRTTPSWDGGMFVDSLVHGIAALRAVLPSKTTTTDEADDDHDNNNNNKKRITDRTVTVSVSAITTSRTDHLPDVDTMTARIEWNYDDDEQQEEEEVGDDDGASTKKTTATKTTKTTKNRGIQGTISATYHPCSSLKFVLDITGTEGNLVLSRNVAKDHPPGYTLKTKHHTKDDENNNNNNHKEGGGEKPPSTSSSSSSSTSFEFGGVDAEYLAFAKACQRCRRHPHPHDHDPHHDPMRSTSSSSIQQEGAKMEALVDDNNDNNDDWNTPEEAFADLLFVEKLLESGRHNGRTIQFQLPSSSSSSSLSSSSS